MAAYVFRTSVQAPFEQFLKGLDYLSDVINKDTNAENFQNIKSARFLKALSSAGLTHRIIRFAHQ